MESRMNFYVVDGAQVPLKRVDSTRLVTPARNTHISHVAARLARSTRLGIVRATPANLLVVRGDADRLDEIRGYNDVHCTRSTYADLEGLEFTLTDEVLVAFTASADDGERRKLCESLNCVVVNDTGDTWKIRVLDTDDDAPLSVANRLSEEKNVRYAQPNALQAAEYACVTPPRDSLFSNQWHLHNTGQNGGQPGADVNALGAWDLTYGSRCIRVVVHDSGVDITHPDLKANIDPGKDFDNDDTDASNDSGPHGTACAGIIAAPLNGDGVVGIAPDCRIVPLRAAGAHTWETWAETFKWAAQRGDIISCSWSITRNDTLTDELRKAATDGRGGKGIPVFFATGNEFRSFISYPSSLSETIAVGASTNKDLHAHYSNRGQGIDFVAPSSHWSTEGTLRIETTDIQGSNGYNETAGGDYCKADESNGFGGTSAATPLVAGVAALMLSVNNELTAEQVRQILRETAVKIDTTNGNYDANGWSPKYGYGRIDAAEAVRQAQALASCR